MLWARSPRGRVRHLVPSLQAPASLCGIVRAGTWAIGLPEQDWSVPVCQNCADVVIQAGELLVLAIRHTGLDLTITPSPQPESE